MRSPLLFLHIVAGTLGMLSGFVAVFLLKGSRRHGLAGNVFTIAMLSLGASGTSLAIVKFQPGNILGGAFTFYLVATAWMAVRRRDREVSLFDWTALLLVVGVTAVEATLGVEAAMSPTGMKYDYPPGPYFFIGSVALVAAVGDVRMLVSGGISGRTADLKASLANVFCIVHCSGVDFWRDNDYFPSSCARLAYFFS